LLFLKLVLVFLENYSSFFNLDDNFPRSLYDNLYAILFIIFIFLYFIYKWAYINSYKIFINGEGVWTYYGYFPWQKAGDGLRWEHFDMAFRSSGFLSWITNSHTIIVKHKYTNNDDFRVTNIWNGEKVISLIEDRRRSEIKKTDFN